MKKSHDYSVKQDCVEPSGRKSIPKVIGDIDKDFDIPVVSSLLQAHKLSRESGYRHAWNGSVAGCLDRR